MYTQLVGSEKLPESVTEIVRVAGGNIFYWVLDAHGLGMKKTDKFEKKIQHKIANLLGELQQADSIYLLSILNQKLIHSIQPEPTELPDSFTQKFHFLCGLIVSLPITQKISLSEDPERLDRILNLTNEVFEEYANLWLSRPSLDGSDEENKVRDYRAGLVAFLTALHEPTLGSTEQFIQLTLTVRAI
mgnify:CR=1 FL=1